jgi:hypothetical protein
MGEIYFGRVMALSRYFPWSKPSALVSGKQATVALAAALIHFDEVAVLQAIAQGADANGTLDPPRVSSSRTFLQHAILSVHPELAIALLKAGADPMATVEMGCFWPAPHLATVHEDCEVIDVLRAHPKADFDKAVMDPLVGETSTARDIAARRNRTFAEWFGQRFSLTNAAKVPVFEDQSGLGLARWREQHKSRH